MSLRTQGPGSGEERQSRARRALHAEPGAYRPPTPESQLASPRACTQSPLSRGGPRAAHPPALPQTSGGLTDWWVFAVTIFTASGSHMTRSPSEPTAILPFRGYRLKIFAALVLVTATNWFSSIFPVACSDTERTTRSFGEGQSKSPGKRQTNAPTSRWRAVPRAPRLTSLLVPGRPRAGGTVTAPGCPPTAASPAPARLTLKAREGTGRWVPSSVGAKP